MNIFATRDEKFHRDEKRPVANAYAMTSLLERELVDLRAWLQYYALGLVGEITFAKKLGSLGERRDIDGAMKSIQTVLVFSSLYGQVPEIYPLLLETPLLPFLTPGIEKSNQVFQFTLKVLNSNESFRCSGEIDKEEKKMAEKT